MEWSDTDEVEYDVTKRAYTPDNLGQLSPRIQELVHSGKTWTPEIVEEMIEEGTLPPLHSIDKWLDGPYYIKVQCTFVHFTGQLVSNVWLPLGFLKAEYPKYVSHIAAKQRIPKDIRSQSEEDEKVMEWSDTDEDVTKRAYTLDKLGQLSHRIQELVHLGKNWTAEIVEELIEEGALPPLHSVDKWLHGPHHVKVRCTFIHYTGHLVRNVWLPLGFLKVEYPTYVSHIAAK